VGQIFQDSGSFFIFSGSVRLFDGLLRGSIKVQFGVSRGRREVLLSGYGRGYRSASVAEFGTRVRAWAADTIAKNMDRMMKKTVTQYIPKTMSANTRLSTCAEPRNRKRNDPRHRELDTSHIDKVKAPQYLKTPRAHLHEFSEIRLPENNFDQR